MNKWIKFGVAAVVVVGVIAYLMISGLSQHTIYYLEVSELLEDPTKFDMKGARISGDVVANSIVKDTMDKKLLQFAISDANGTAMNVEYKGVVPDAFEEGVTVIVEGNYDPVKQIFFANTLLAKCPSKYEGEDPADHVATTEQQ